jgi:hypothetical protein
MISTNRYNEGTRFLFKVVYILVALLTHFFLYARRCSQYLGEFERDTDILGGLPDGPKTK